MPDAVGTHPLGYPSLLAVATDKLVDADRKRYRKDIFPITGTYLMNYN